MADFTTRVVLHGKHHDHPNYDKLHDAMERAGFSRLIQGENNVWYHLPPAEYRIRANMTASEVANVAQAVANSVDVWNGVFVTEGSSCAWNGLTQA
ncbi:hypothetical protein DM48_6813 [Burkholderia gladioli]|uniref:Uncharacterized protein n=1 Tax=Burkholderia gladioli TaxID=28095 RepID=A0AAW3ENM7_BURGA|nr:DUF2622 domain-containing protein [Burkholderia gladioli]KGC09393.1 hypothetical protein DM48_6813 [Burkholderia gladioli]